MSSWASLDHWLDCFTASRVRRHAAGGRSKAITKIVSSWSRHCVQASLRTVVMSVTWGPSSWASLWTSSASLGDRLHERHLGTVVISVNGDCRHERHCGRRQRHWGTVVMSATGDRRHERHWGPSSWASLGDRRHERHWGPSSWASPVTVAMSVTGDRRHGHWGGGTLQTHKLRFLLLRPQSCRVTPLKPRVGQIVCRSKDLKGSKERCLLGQNTTCQFSG